MNLYGTPSEIADALDDYNIWRRGADRPAPDTVALGRVIESAAHTLRSLEREVTHWKANHATEVRRARILKERTDMPIERVEAYEHWGKDKAELDDLRRHAIDNAEIEGLSFSPIGGNKYLAMCRDGFKKCGIAMQRIEQDGRVTRVWVGTHGMILWPRLETEVSDEKAELSKLRSEAVILRTLARTRAESSDLYLRKYQELKQRTDELTTLDTERAANALLTEENERLRKQLDDDADVCNVCDKGSTRPTPRFPVELRKMWSGSEVQQWLDEQFAK